MMNSKHNAKLAKKKKIICKVRSLNKNKLIKDCCINTGEVLKQRKIYTNAAVCA